MCLANHAATQPCMHLGCSSVSRLRWQPIRQLARLQERDNPAALGLLTAYDSDKSRSEQSAAPLTNGKHASPARCLTPGPMRCCITDATAAQTHPTRAVWGFRLLRLAGWHCIIAFRGI